MLVTLAALVKVPALVGLAVLPLLAVDRVRAAALLVLAALGRLDPVLALGSALLGVAVLLPVVQPWYLLWGVCVLAARVGPRGAAALGAGCLVLCLAIAPSGRHVVRPPVYGLQTLLAGAVAVAVWQGRPTALRTR